MDKVDLAVGTKIELELVDKHGQKIGQTYISQVLDVADDKNILIAAPIHESRLTFILSGTNIRIVFLHNVHGLLSFTGVITKKEMMGNLAGFYVKRNDEFKKIQRRQYFRFDCILDVKYCKHPNESENKIYCFDNGSEYKRGITKDISGCGACIITDEEIPKGELLAVEIALTNEAKLNTVSKIIRCQRIEGLKEKKFQLGLYFNHISHKDQDVLVKFIFDQERLLLKKTNYKRD